MKTKDQQYNSEQKSPLKSDIYFSCPQGRMCSVDLKILRSTGPAARRIENYSQKEGHNLQEG